MTFKNIQVLLTANNSNLKGVLAQSATQVDAFGRQVERSNKGLADSGKLMKAGLAGGALAAGAGLAYATVKAIEFDSSMRNVNSLLALNEEQFQALSGELIAMSTRLPQSANTLAEGLYDIASSGFAGAEGLQILEAAAQSASAGLTTTDVSAGAIAATINAYGLEAKDAADVSDVLFQTVNAGVISFEELAGGIGDVVGGAAAAKVSIDQVGSAIAAMTLTGIGGAEATTSLNALMTKLVQPGEALANMYKKLGYESGASALETKGLRGVMEDLRKETGGNITTLLELFPEIRAARGALALMANEGGNYKRVSEQISDAEARRGATLRTLNEQMKSAKNQLTLFKNELDATAITLGTMVIPLLLDLMDGAQAAGGAIKDGLLDIVKALGPTWENLAEIGRDLWAVLESIGEVAGPVGELLAKLAVGGVISAINGLTGALSLMTGALEAGGDATQFFAIMLGVALVATSTLGTRIYVGLVLGLVGLIDMLGRAAAAMAGFNGAAALSLLKVGGIAALVAGAIIAWQSYSSATKDAKRAVDDWNEAQRSDNLEQQVAGVKAITGELQSMEDRLKELDNRDWLSDIFNVGAAAEELGIRRSIDDVAAAAEEAEKKFEVLRQGVLQYSYDAAKGKVPTEELANRFAQAEGAAKTFSDMLPTLVAAGVQVGDTMETVKQKLDAYKQSQSTAGAEKSLIDTLGAMQAGAIDTATAVQNLKDSLDRLMGVFLSSDKAAIQFEAALDDMTASVKENGKSLDINSEKGRANKLAIMDAVGALRDKIEADAAAGVGSEELAKRLEAGRKKLREQAVAAGFTAGEIDGLLERYNLTPELVQTIVEALGVQPTKEQLAALAREADKLNKTVTINVRANTLAARAALSELDGRSRSGYATGGYVSGPGGPTDDKIPALLSNGEYVVRASAVRKVGVTALDQINRYAGGGLVQRFAKGGGPVRPVPWNMGLAGYAAKFDDPKDLADLLAKWDRYVRQLELVARRTELVAQLDEARAAAAKADADSRVQALERVKQAQASLKEFDRSVALDKERQSVTDLITKLEDERRAREEAARAAEQQERKRREIADNMFELGQITTAAHINELNARLAKEEEYTDAWMALYRQRERLLNEEKARREASLANLNRLLDAEAAAHQKRADAEAAHSRAVAQAHARAAADASRLQADLAGRLAEAREAANERELRATADHAARTVKARQAAAELVARAQETSAKQTLAAVRREAEGVEQILRTRQEQVRDWMRLDELMASRDSVFAVTSDDEAGARAALRAAGLLTAAMDQWNESQAAGPMSAADLAANAREQAAVIREWSAGLDALRARGLSEEVISALGLDESPAAMEQVRAFASATEAEIQDLNDAVVDKAAAANERVKLDQAGMYGEVGRGLADVRRVMAEELAAAAEQLAESIAESQTRLQESLAEADTTLQESLLESQVRLNEQLANAQAQYAEGMAAVHQQLAESIASADATLASALEDVEQMLKDLGGQQGRSYGEAIAEGIKSQIPAVREAVAELQALLASQAQLEQDTRPTQAPRESAKNTGPWKRTGRRRTYDTGGILPPGTTLATNLTGQDEYVMKAAQLAAFGRIAAARFGKASPSISVTYQVDASGAVEGTAAQISAALERHTDDLLRVVSAGTRE